MVEFFVSDIVNSDSNTANHDGIPKDWKIIEHIHLNSSEGHGAEPYCIDVYEDSKGSKHEVFAGTFNADDARRN